jgi:hypothetical protein
MKRIRTITGFFLTLMFLVLASCNGQTTASPQPQETSTRTPAPTSSPRPTYIYPTMQPANATRIAKPHAAKATFTPNTQTAFEECGGYPYTWVSDPIQFSPSGNWKVAYCVHPDSGASYTKVIHRLGNVEWEVPYLDEEGLNRPEGEDGGQMLVGAWSYNEKYAFLIRYFCCSGDGGLSYFFNGHGLYRLNLNTGDILEMKETSDFSFSSDGKHLARYNYGAKNVIVENLELEKISSFNFSEDFDLAGMFSWSPDSSKVIFFATNKNSFGSGMGFAIYLIDINDLKIELLSSPSHYFYIEKWLSPSEALLRAEKLDWSALEFFILNVSTHELIPSDSDGIPLTPTL